MVPKLSIEGYRALLEQSRNFWDSNTFTRVLLVNKRSVSIARLNSLYRFGMCTYTIYPGHYWLEHHLGEKTTEIPMMAAYRLFSLLKPSIFVASNYKDRTQAEFGDFLDDSDCKIIIKHCGRVSTTLLKPIWSRIIEITVYGDNVNKFNRLSPSSFDKLTVCQIEDFGQLQEALRHDTKKLSLAFSSKYPHDQATLDRIQDLVPGRIENCTITLDYKLFEAEKSTPLLRCFINLLQPSLSRLGVVYDFNPSETFKTMAGLVQKMNFLVEESTKLAESLGEANVDSTIKIKFRYHRSGEDFEGDWMGQLQKQPFFTRFQSKTEEKENSDVHLKLERKVENVDLKIDLIFYGTRS